MFVSRFKAPGHPRQRILGVRVLALYLTDHNGNPIKPIVKEKPRVDFGQVPGLKPGRFARRKTKTIRLMGKPTPIAPRRLMEMRKRRLAAFLSP